MRLEAFGGCVLERLIRREDLSGHEAAAALGAAPLPRVEKLTMVFEQPPET
jgi:hypothetical protein